MDFDLTAEQRDLQRICRSFADEEIVPYVREHRDLEWEGSAEERFPESVWRVAHEVGLHVLNVPERYGGAGSMRAQGVERYVRDAATNLHLHGTQDIHEIKLVNELTGKGDPGTHA